MMPLKRYIEIIVERFFHRLPLGVRKMPKRSDPLSFSPAQRMKKHFNRGSVSADKQFRHPKYMRRKVWLPSQPEEKHS